MCARARASKIDEETYGGVEEENSKGRNEMRIERCREENAGTGKLNVSIDAERSCGALATKQSFLYVSLAIFRIGEKDSLEVRCDIQRSNRRKKMSRLIDLRACFFLLLAIQLDQYFPWNRGAILIEGIMEAQFEKCCELGTSWAREGLGCEKFAGPVPGVPTVEQGLCLEAVDICCVREYHERQCQKGKADARAGLACVKSGAKTRRLGPGDYHRDCCEGCKLGILAGSMGQECAFKRFTFGIPWDPAFLECCYEASPSTTTTFTSDSTNGTSPSQSTDASSSSGTQKSSNPTSFSPSVPTPPLDDICQLMKGLCSDICVPTPGSYYCKCREGFTLLEDEKTCRQNLPVDRCKSTNPCEQRCTDNGVAVICSCNPGYVLANDGRSCIPRSSDRESIRPDEGSDLSPVCPNGYRYNATRQVCDDVNECTEKGLCSGRCENTIGSYVCSSKDPRDTPYEECPIGYQWDPATKLCTDIDECVILSEPCPGEKKFCVNTQGSFNCLEMKGIKSCPAGFKFDKLSQQCKDVNECAEGIHSCLDGSEECRNTEGAYECDVKCRKGFTYSINLGTCIDVDECIELNNPCSGRNATCKNTIGSYECASFSNNSLPFPSVDQTELSTCPAGYKTTNNPTESCVDVDECKERLHSCDADEKCVNEIGSYRCELSYEGRRLDGKDGAYNDFSYKREHEPQIGISPTAVAPTANVTVICESGFFFDRQIQDCIDIDECNDGLSNCGIGEQCVNFEGGYRCSPACPPGFQPPNNTDYMTSIDVSCKDINECVLGLHSCNATTHYCVNTNGSYHCQPFVRTTTTTTIKPKYDSKYNKLQNIAPFLYVEPCKRGYARDLVTGECMDVDECVSGPGCRDHEQCHNTPGGYECSPLCTTGWYFSPTTKGCQDVDECLLGRHDCPQGTHRCVNTNGSYICELIPPCNSGFKRSFAGSCIDIDECSENTHTCRLELHQYCVNRNGSFECLTRLPSCEFGYEYSLAVRRCVDIDECSTGQYKCDSKYSEKCINLPGTYKCERLATFGRQRQKPACPSGFRYHPRLRRCTDIDECAEGLDSCKGEVCYNQPGGYSCAKLPTPATRTPPATANQMCAGGSRFVRNRGCVDIDECREVEDVCTSNEQCVNTMGGYTCNCKTGFKRDDLTQACVDINECQIQEDSCLPTQRCDNTIGSYTCTRFLPCGTGYTLNAATEICEDDDECSLGTHDCGDGYHCRNTLGSYRCDRNPRTPVAQPRIGASTLAITTTTPSPVTPPLLTTQWPTICPRGFELAPGNKCLDIDECKLNPNLCGRTTQRCINTIGSYKCTSRVICSNGYTLDPVSGQYCIDVDECADGSHECSPDQTCENRLGGYVCVCPSGHVNGPNKDCVDIDECSIYGNVCGSNSRCENTAGSYRCICESGFENAAGYNDVCRDVDECQRIPGLCQHMCTNVPGSYRCSCRRGFRLNPDNRSCTDVDECTEFKSHNLCVGICENTPGSYACKCPDGYRLGLSGRTCEDIDECSTGNACRGSDEICHNTRGGFRCNKINCPAGYHRDHERKNRCVRTWPCSAQDTACHSSPLHYSYNFITLVSMFPIAPNRPEEIFKMKGYHPAGSVIQFSMAFVDVRAPPGVQRATESCFALRRPAPSQAVLVMTRSIQGPQEIELDLSMEVYHNTVFAASAVAKILIYVSQYEF
ncbi:fibrillin-1-like [Hylaeus anthracinus]|uniref:fibrillin-1-like n=1 Tax=Hylaeus anthracinus TaxID=313031 RepID=UPI0023BA0C45|nr:fibrillin-1-like [Hylaeus anthracinus]